MARLTKLQKEILDNAVLDYVKKNVVEGGIIPNINMLMENVRTGFPYGRVSMVASMDRLLENYSTTHISCIYGIFYYKDTYHIYIHKPTYKVRKEKNLLYFEDLGDEYYYDFITKKFSKDFLGDKVITHCRNLYRYSEEDFSSALLENEWLFNYCDDLVEIKNITSSLPNEILKTAPKGLVDALKENNNKLSKTLLKDLYYLNIFGKYYKFFSAFLYNNSNVGINIITDFIKDYNAENIFKMIKLNLLNGNIYWQDDLARLIINYVLLKKNGLSTIRLDLNRDLAYNVKSLKDLVDAERNKILERQLQKLNFINSLTKGNLKVVVPQSQLQKQDEGRQQNNCVGHYYDDSIIRGDNFIYFIRKADNDKKSYVTCRYNVRHEETIEYRVKNNYAVHDEEVIKFINEIDQKIRANLK